jgi:hypothetical protein
MPSGSQSVHADGPSWRGCPGFAAAALLPNANRAVTARPPRRPIILKSGFVKVLRASRRSEFGPRAGGAKKSKIFCAISHSGNYSPQIDLQSNIQVMPLRCRHCRSDDDFKIRFCESTPRQPEIRIIFGGRGAKKAKFCVAVWRDPDSSSGGNQITLHLTKLQ